jgi:hypothetical protein
MSMSHESPCIFIGNLVAVQFFEEPKCGFYTLNLSNETTQFRNFVALLDLNYIL